MVSFTTKAKHRHATLWNYESAAISSENNKHDGPKRRIKRRSQKKAVQEVTIIPQTRKPLESIQRPYGTLLDIGPKETDVVECNNTTSNKD